MFLVSGEAEHEVDEFLKEEHSLQEYKTVSGFVAFLSLKILLDRHEQSLP